MSSAIPTLQRAVRIAANTPLKNPLDLRVAADVPVPHPLPPTHVLVKNTVSGVNFIDTYHRSGLYPNPNGTLGVEGAGVVVAAADPADAPFVGRRVAYGGANFGSYAEFSAVPSGKCVVLPDDVTDEAAVCFMMSGLTAHYLTRDATGGIQLGPGKWVLVQAAGSGTGNVVAQVASLMGATVIGTASTGKLAAAKERGRCRHVLDYSTLKGAELAAKVKSLTPKGLGVDVVFDGVGKDTYDSSLSSVRPRGTVAFFGNASGPVPPLDVLLLSQKGSITVTRPALAHFIADPEEYRRRVSDVLDWHRRGLLKLDIDREFPLEEAGAAQKYLEDGKTRGKVLLRIAGGGGSQRAAAI